MLMSFIGNNVANTDALSFFDFEDTNDSAWLLHLDFPLLVAEFPKMAGLWFVFSRRY
jgi:hypothetical protein